MTGIGDPALRQLTLTVITSYSGSHADAAALAAAARRAYGELVRVSVPLIGALGFDALLGRAVHVARREHPWLADVAASGEDRFGAVVVCVRQRDATSAAEGAAAVLAVVAGLLVSLIGEGLTWRLLRQAWPTGFLGQREHETDI